MPASSSIRERDLSHILETSLNEIYVFRTRDLRFVWGNRGALENIGYSLAELQERTPVDIKPTLDEASFQALVAPLRAGELTLSVFETIHQRKDGSRYPVEVHLQINEYLDQQCFIAIILDISRRKTIEAERERLIQELEARAAEMERFTYTVSHELKGPLITIRGFLGLLEQDIAAGAAEKVKGDIRYISSATQTMHALLEDLLELSRVGRVQDTREPLALGPLLDQVLQSSAGRLREVGVAVTVQDDLPEIFADRKRVSEVFANLIDNAAKFMGDQPAPAIEIGCRPPDTGPMASLFVRDNGVGIAPRHHERIFRLFERLEPEISGTGIGLPLVKRIVETHGGQVRIEPGVDGRGTTFVFTLPRAAAATPGQQP